MTGSVLVQTVTSDSIRRQVSDLAGSCGLGRCHAEMLEYTVGLFESRGLGADYYGYHNIRHELEVAYGTLLVGSYYAKNGDITEDELAHLFAAALLHDFNPEKGDDKPQEEEVIKFVTTNEGLTRIYGEARLDIEVIKALILRTTYPWRGRQAEKAARLIDGCLEKVEGWDRSRVLWLGWLLSVTDRVIGYSMGDFAKSMEMAKMNAHASGWHPSVIVRRSVAYFENLLDSEPEMVKMVLQALPRQMRENFYRTIQSFMELRRSEIMIQAEYIYDNLKLVPVIEKPGARDGLAEKLLPIYDELPRPLQFARDRFAETMSDPRYIVNTLRLDGPDGEIVGFAKGGPLEMYELRPQIRDVNRGLKNTVFMEPLAIKMGYWGMRGGSEMRHMFVMQASSMNFEYLTSFAQRDLIQKRIDAGEQVEFVERFDPEKWDYYRISI